MRGSGTGPQFEIRLLQGLSLEAWLKSVRSGLDGGTEGPLGIGDPLHPSPVTFSQRISF